MATATTEVTYTIDMEIIPEETNIDHEMKSDDQEHTLLLIEEWIVDSLREWEIEVYEVTRERADGNCFTFEAWDESSDRLSWVTVTTDEF